MLTQVLKNKIVQNAGWLMGSKIVHMILSFVIGLLTARFLGPSNYGLINYASAYTTFFTSFCTLGINSIIVKKFIDAPKEEGVTLGTTFILRLSSTVLAIGIISGLVTIVDKGENVTKIVVVLYSFGLFFCCFDSYKQWFQAKLKSKYYAIATMVSYSFVTLYKVFLLISGKSVIWFAISNSVDHLIITIILYYFYKKLNGPKLKFSIDKAKELLSESYSYILSGLMIAIYGSTDKIMLKQLLDESEVGYYSLALSLSCIWTFVLSAIIESMVPSIMKYHSADKEKYRTINVRLYTIVFYISIFSSIAICILAPFIVGMLYGKDYLGAVIPLRIVVWYVAFSYLGVARDAWVVCEKKQKYLKYLYLGSAVCNVVLNVVFIPVLGANGAAIATVMTQMSTIFITPLLIKDFHPNIHMMIDAIVFKDVLRKKTKE